MWGYEGVLLVAVRLRLGRVLLFSSQGFFTLSFFDVGSSLFLTSSQVEELDCSPTNKERDVGVHTPLGSSIPVHGSVRLGASQPRYVACSCFVL